METLTDKQQAVLDFIEERTTGGFTVPSMREIAKQLNLASVSTAYEHVKALIRKGRLKGGPGGQARSLRLAHQAPEKRIPGIPLIGYIPAGHGDDRTEEDGGMVYYDLEALRLPKGARVFGLKVTGDSMIGVHIQDGDIVILEQGADPRSGEVVAALIDGAVTLKTFITNGRKIWLKAENPAYPNLIPAGELVIQGVMRSLIRQNQIIKRK